MVWSKSQKFISTRGLEPLSLPYTLDDFWRTIFLTLYFTNWPNFIVWMPLLFGILDNICIAIVYFSVDDVKFLTETLALLPIYLPAWPIRSGQKPKYYPIILKMKRDLKVSNKKHFSSFLKGIYWRK